MTKANTTASPEKIKQAREKLDAHVREIVDWHFNPETGTPFWLEQAKTLRLRSAQGSSRASTT